MDASPPDRRSRALRIDGIHPLRPRCAAALLLALAALTVWPLASAGEETPTLAPPTVRAARATQPIRLDGVLDEADWQSAPAIDSFTQRYPAEGSPASQATRVRILYDDERLYIGAVLSDDEPDRIVAREMKEDAPLDNDDSFFVVIDTFHDRRNGFFFETNPLGARTDALVFDEGRNNSFDWDGVWEVSAKVTPTGWSVEMEIPFKTLHFDPARTGSWGLQIGRVIRRNAEDAYWAPIPRNEDKWRLSRAGELTGLEGIRQGRHLEVKPYALGAVERRPSFGETAVEGREEGGVDVRYAVTPNLSAIATVHTDFAETEVDDQQVNLTRFPIFFPEKREFFLESKGYFDFGYRKSPFSFAGPIPFFSRRIGLGPRTVGGETVDAPVPILGGVKLAGRLDRCNIGFLSVETEADGGTPQTNFTALRVSRDILTRSNWGILAVSKEPAGPSDAVDPNDFTAGSHSNRTYGADMNFSVLQNFRFGGALLETRTPSITDGQRAGRLYVDWSDSAWDTELSYKDIARHFNPEAGFVERTGIEELGGFLGWSWRSKTALIRKVEPHARFTYTMDQEHDLATRRQHWATSIEFRDGSTVELAWNPMFDRPESTFELSSRAFVPPGAYTMASRYSVRIDGDPSRVVSASASSEFGDFFDGRYQTVVAGLFARISEHLKASATVQRNDIHLPDRPGGIDPSEFLTTLAQARLGVTFTTRLFFDALVQYNTEVRDVSTNLRLNVKYRPGSDIYLVYNERRDIEGLPTDVVDRSFTVKWTYLVSL
ncbi:MAG: carbohydrate binding family 9 domain-containing protein [Acidobacteria bacterium]|nr:carbohydrate binding family 9 domain-containing protein [Acidobacteriota bacterium]